MEDETRRSPFERIGGAETVATLVDAFYDRVLADPDLAPFFEHADLPKLLEMQRLVFSMALGGPDSYVGRSLAHAHRGRGISREHFQKFVDHLFETLEEYELTETERHDMIGRINTYSSDILGGYGVSG
jgi:hemoglobin